MVTRPSCGARWNESSRSSDVLPQPFGPSTTQRSSVPTTRSSGPSTRTPPSASTAPSTTTAFVACSSVTGGSCPSTGRLASMGADMDAWSTPNVLSGGGELAEGPAGDGERGKVEHAGGLDVVDDPLVALDALPVVGEPGIDATTHVGVGDR